MNLKIVTIVAALTGTAWAQSIPFRASLTGGGSENRGKCTIEVVVDGAAEVSIRGDNAILTNLKGQPAQWRRFECNGVMPSRPADFRFQGVDGRGSQTLVRDPRSGGPAVIQILDSDNGTEGYTFDIFWGGGSRGGFEPDRGRDDRSRRDYDDYRSPRPGSGPGGFGQSGADAAIRNCQDAVVRQAADRFRARDLVFRRLTVENDRGSRDTVHGFAESRQRRSDYQFFCDVNLRDGSVRGVDLQIQ